MKGRWKLTLKQRLFAKIKLPAHPDDCWLWTGAVQRSKGSTEHYGNINVGGNSRLAHRVMYEVFIGTIPSGMELDHIDCVSTLCVNPTHLRVATGKQNRENLRLRRDSTSGVRGVSWSRANNKWRVQVGHYGKRYGSYHDTLEEAENAAKELRLRLFTHNEQDRKMIMKRKLIAVSTEARKLLTDAQLIELSVPDPGSRQLVPSVRPASAPEDPAVRWFEVR